MKLKINYIFPLLVGISICQTSPVLAASYGTPTETPEAKNVTSLLKNTLGDDRIPAAVTDLIGSFLTHEESCPITGACKSILVDRRILRVTGSDGMEPRILFKGIEPSLLEGMHTVIIGDTDQNSISGALGVLIKHKMNPKESYLSIYRGNM